MFSTNSQVLKKCSYKFYSNCQNSLWPLTKCPLRFVTLDITRKNRPQYFYHWKVCHFFQKFVFSTTSQVLKNALICSTVMTRKPFGPLQIFPGGLSHSIEREKIGHKVFFTGNFDFFLKKKLCFQQTLRS